MIEIIQAPNQPTTFDGLKIFLAGGISHCPKWQDEISERLMNEPRLKKYSQRILVFNPRCKQIPEEEPQIKWEYEKLHQCDIISFWFSVGSLNPITLFEYGSHFKSRKKIIVGCHPDYERKNNVKIQTQLAKPSIKINENFEDFYNDIVNNIIKKLDKKK